MSEKQINELLDELGINHEKTDWWEKVTRRDQGHLNERVLDEDFDAE